MLLLTKLQYWFFIRHPVDQIPLLKTDFPAETFSIMTQFRQEQYNLFAFNQLQIKSRTANYPQSLVRARLTCLIGSTIQVQEHVQFLYTVVVMVTVTDLSTMTTVKQAATVSMQQIKLSLLSSASKVWPRFIDQCD